MSDHTNRLSPDLMTMDTWSCRELSAVWPDAYDFAYPHGTYGRSRKTRGDWIIVKWRKQKNTTKQVFLQLFILAIFKYIEKLTE